MSAPVAAVGVDPCAQCLSALDALYNHADPAVKRSADQWLTAFQVDRGVWSVADALLHRGGLHETAYFFAANTLLLKVQYSFAELTDAAQRAAFRASLLSHVARFAVNGSTLIRSKLAQCVACVAVHLLGMGEWPGAVGALVESFGGEPNTALVLLDILAFMPEENHNTRLQVHSTVRVRAQREMMREAEQIIKLLMHYLASSTQTTSAGQAQTDYVSSGILLTPNTGAGAVLLPRVSGLQKSMHSKILGTFLAWVKASGEHRQFTAPPSMGPAPADVVLSSEHLINHPLILFCFKIVASRCDELEQIAIDVLSSLLQNFNLVSRSARGASRGFQSASQYDEDQYDGDDYEEGQWGSGSFAPNQQQQLPSQYQHIYFMRFMIARIMELVPLFDALPPPTGSLDDEDEHSTLARSYGRLFADLGEFYLDFIVEFSIGAEGFSEAHDPEALQNMRATMVTHAATEAALKQQAPVQPDQAALEELISSNRALTYQIVDVVLKCARSARREVNMSVLYFWFLLSKSLNAIEWGARGSSRNNKASAAPTTSGLTPIQIRARKKQVFQPAFQQVIPQLHRLIVLPVEWAPPNAPQTLSAEANEEVKKAREQAGATLVDIETILGHESILELLTGDAVMGAQLATYVADRQQWRELEASLYCFWRLGNKVCGSFDEAREFMPPAIAFAQGGRTNTHLLPKVLDLLLDAQSPVSQSQPLKNITLKILSCYAPWIKEHARATELAKTGASDYLGRALSCIVSGLQDGSVCKAASRALREICEHNRERLANCQQPNYINALMQVYSSCCTVAVATNSTNAQGMTLNDQRSIIEGVAAVVSCVHSVPPPANGTGAQAAQGSESNLLPHYLHQIVLPMVTEMQKIVTTAQQMAPPSSAGAAVIPLPSDVSVALTNHLERLAETIAKLSPSLNPNRAYFITCVLDLFQRVLAPLLYGIMQLFSSDERRMDKLCRVVKHVIKTTKLEFLPQCLEPLIHNLHAAFNRYPHACFLYLLGVHCVDYFGMHPHFHPILAQMLPAFMTTCLRAIPDKNAMVHDPDMTEDFFMTCTKVIEKCPDIFFSLQILPQSQPHEDKQATKHRPDLQKAFTHSTTLLSFSFSPSCQSSSVALLVCPSSTATASPPCATSSIDS